MTTLPRIRAALTLALLTVVCLPAVALGHAELVSSDPADGGTISEPPYQLTAEFNEELAADRSRIVVRDAAGNEVARGGVSEDDAAVMVVDLEGVAPGSYTARWTAVTPDDSGITRGNIDFTIAQATPSPTPSVTAPPTGSPTATPTSTASVPPSASPSLSVSPSPSPTGGNGSPAAGTTDLLIALLVAGAAIAALMFFLWRRRSA